jgi:hypothetical protein
MNWAQLSVYALDADTSQRLHSRFGTYQQIARKEWGHQIKSARRVV